MRSRQLRLLGGVFLGLALALLLFSISKVTSNRRGVPTVEYDLESETADTQSLFNVQQEVALLKYLSYLSSRKQLEEKDLPDTIQAKLRERWRQERAGLSGKFDEDELRRILQLLMDDIERNTGSLDDEKTQRETQKDNFP